MAQLSFSDVENLWIANGGDAGWAPLAAGLAWAESRLNTTSLGDNPGTSDYSVGLWQINYYDGLRADRTARYGSPEELLADPNKQAIAAIDIFGNGAGAGAWAGNDGHGNAAQPTYLAWRDAGFPQRPSESTVLSWLAAKGADAAQLTAGGSSSTGEGATAAPSDYALTGGNTFTGAGGRETGCAGGSKGISFGGVSVPVFGNVGKVDTGIGNACQIKALTGGLMVGLGGAMVITGLVLIVAAVAGGTRAGKAAAGVVGTVAGGPAGGAVASAVTGGGSRRRRASVKPAADAVDDATVTAMQASAKEQTRQRRENPSEKQKEFERNRRAAQRANRFALQPGETAFP